MPPCVRDLSRYTSRQEKTAQRAPTITVRRSLPFPEGLVYVAGNPDEYGALALVAKKANVTKGMVRHWRYRGWLTPTGERHFVRTMDRRYHFGDVLQAEADTYANANSHRERALVA